MRETTGEEIGMKALTALALTGAVTLSAGAVADELTYGSWVGPSHGVMVHALPPVFDGVAADTDGGITWTLLAGGQVVTGNTTLAGLRDGLIDAGFVLAPYTPSDLPATNMVFNQLVFGRDIVAAAGAMNEAVLLHCPECLAEAQASNAVFLAGYAASPYVLICTSPVTTVAELEGKQVRASGGGVDIMNLAGAVPRPMSPADATEALQRNEIDCVLGSPAWLRSYSYWDVATDVLDYPFGMGGPAMHWVMRRGAWEDMTDEQRAAHLRHMPRSIAEATLTAYVADDAEVTALAKERGITFVEGGEDFDALIAQRDEAQRAANIEAAQGFGVENAEEIMAAFEQALEKWQGLSAEIGTDVEKFAAALDREIYQKLDPSSL